MASNGVIAAVSNRRQQKKYLAGLPVPQSYNACAVMFDGSFEEAIVRCSVTSIASGGGCGSPPPYHLVDAIYYV
jgi:hypothetical protein